MTVTQQSYSNLAEDYDRVRFGGRKGQFLARSDAAILEDLVQKAGVRSILDCPVGTGRALTYLGEKDVELVGFDYTWEMIEIAASRRSEKVVGIARGDAKQLPFPDESFDCVLSLRFFHLFPPEERQPFIDEFHRVLKPGGYLLCSYTNGWHGFGVNWIKKWTGKLGVTFEMPGELRKLKSKWQVVARRGNYMPGQRLTTYLGSWAEKAARWVTFRAPLNRFCHERFYLLKKK